MKAASKSFIRGYTKYTSRIADYNGAAGRIWVKRTWVNGAWVHQGCNFVRKLADEVEVEAAFDTDLAGVEA